jgi:hypothetical protein
MELAGQAFKLGNDQHATVLPALGKRGGELGRVRVRLAALRFDKLRCERAACVSTAGRRGRAVVVSQSWVYPSPILRPDTFSVRLGLYFHFLYIAMERS